MRTNNKQISNVLVCAYIGALVCVYFNVCGAGVNVYVSLCVRSLKKNVLIPGHILSGFNQINPF